MSSLNSNRDLYVSIDNLRTEYQSSTRSLEEYLRAMLKLSQNFAQCQSLSIEEFYTLISESFTTQPAEFDEEWRSLYNRLPTDLADYSGWRSTLIKQIVDLREMGEHGMLANEYRYFGINSPRNAIWYNFDPVGYLECGMAGAFGGWEPDDESGRQLVPGAVCVIAADGSIQTVDPQDIPRPQFEITTITWDELKDFIECGQYYE